MADRPKRFCLFNCDNTCDLKTVEEFLVAVEEKYGYKISVHSHYFGLRQMAEMVETTLPSLKMDFAIFVVHANESRLSINEDNAGIGYARIYRALLQLTGELNSDRIVDDTQYSPNFPDHHTTILQLTGNHLNCPAINKTSVED